MTREEAKELLPIIQAFIDGKTIQCRVSAGSLQRNNRDFSYLKEWFDIDEDKFDGFCCDGTINYRIKPEPKYRPFKSQEECWNEMLKHQPFGYIKGKGTNNVVHITQISTSTISNEFYFDISNSTDTYKSKDLFDYYTFADGIPFGIKE